MRRAIEVGAVLLVLVGCGTEMPAPKTAAAPPNQKAIPLLDTGPMVASTSEAALSTGGPNTVCQTCGDPGGEPRVSYTYTNAKARTLSTMPSGVAAYGIYKYGRSWNGTNTASFTLNSSTGTLLGSLKYSVPVTTRETYTITWQGLSTTVTTDTKAGTVTITGPSGTVTYQGRIRPGTPRTPEFVFVSGDPAVISAEASRIQLGTQVINTLGTSYLRRYATSGIGLDTNGADMMSQGTCDGGGFCSTEYASCGGCTGGGTGDGPSLGGGGDPGALNCPGWGVETDFGVGWTDGEARRSARQYLDDQCAQDQVGNPQASYLGKCASYVGAGGGPSDVPFFDVACIYTLPGGMGVVCVAVVQGYLTCN